MNTKESFSTRLAQLRTDEEISAREMSLDLGQNPSYINRIENQKAYPSMQVFFYSTSKKYCTLLTTGLC